MKAIRIHEHGNVSKIRIDDIDEPHPRHGEVKIRIKASALNHMDLWVRDGIPGIGKLPLTLGCDGSGVVDTLGEGVTRFAKGDRVVLYPVLSCGHCSDCARGLESHCTQMKLFGEHVDGTHAESISVPERNVLLMDDSISFEEAAAFPLVFLTAWHMLVYNAQVKPGEVVLVVGAGSGVGSAAIQIAKLHGAEVIATCGGTVKMGQAIALGADHVIDHHQEDIAKRVREITHKKGVDIVFEHVGVKVWESCLRSLAMNGRLVTCGATTGPLVNMDLRHVFIKQQKIIGSTMGSLSEMLLINKFMAQKKLKPVISSVFPFTEVAQAQRYFEESRHFGKVILSWHKA